MGPKLLPTYKHAEQPLPKNCLPTQGNVQHLTFKSPAVRVSLALVCVIHTIYVTYLLYDILNVPLFGNF